ncbi:NAD-dependent epimerase/dehydratase family protein [Hyunsoonleella rubra]|uniref:NAD-dependent epimerase/dehydratase family protein n=1 Tax=Hyunsoonleella rubra TaxID=1737062 RepID=A0ABW5TC69_9FLAO
MKVLLTGATGYIGRQLALALAERNIQVNALVRDLHSLKVPKHENFFLFKGDICDYASIENAIKECSYVMHTAAYTNLKCRNIDNFYNTNVIGTENLLKAAWKHQVKKVVYTSTLSVYGPSYNQIPITETQPRITSYANDYELTKSMSEEIVRQYSKKGLSSVILNVSKVYGPGLGTYSNGVNRLISMIAKKDFLLVPNRLKSTSNYVFINDVVHAHLLAMESDVNYGRYIIGGENISYKQLFSLIKTLTQSKIKILQVNYAMVKAFFSIASIFQNLLRVAPSITPKVLDSLFVNRISSSLKAQKELNYKITPLHFGLKKTVEYLNLNS